MQKVFNFFKNKLYFVKNHPKFVKFEKEILPIIMDFLLTGPTLLGYVLELWLRPVNSLRFQLAIQSFIFFLIYLILIIFAETIAYFLDDEKIILYIRSFLALVYLLLGFFSFYKLRQGKPFYVKKLNFFEKYFTLAKFDESSPKIFSGN